MNTIVAQTRDPSAKAKQLRRAGIVPCVIYGAGLPESLSIQIDQSTARKLRRSSRNGSKLDIRLEDRTYPVLIKDLDYNQVSDEIVHISFHLLDAGKKYNSIADIVLLNRDTVPGILEILQTQVPHAAEPEHLLDTVTVDLEGLPIGTTLTIGDIPAFRDDQIDVLADPGSIVLRIKERKRAETRAGA